MQYTVNLNLKKPELTDYVDIRHINDNFDSLDTTVNNKVDKITGKGLSTEDYTTAEKTKLSGIQAGAQVNTVNSVAGKTGVVTLAKADVGLGSVENYGIATQAEAEAGTSNVKYMTPSKVKDAINYQGFSRYVSGSYVGDGASLRTINIGVRPVRLIVHPTFDNGTLATLHYVAGGFYTGRYDQIYPTSGHSLSGTNLITKFNKLNETYIWEAWY